MTKLNKLDSHYPFITFIQMIKINSPYQPIKVFIGLTNDGEYNSSLFKIENMPALKYNFREYDCYGDDWDKFLDDNSSFKEALEKIGSKAFGSGYDIREDMYLEFNIVGNFKSQTKQAYINVADDASCFLTDTLDNFDVEYHTEEQWDITQWEEI